MRFVNGRPMNFNVFNENFDDDELQEGPNGPRRQGLGEARNALPTMKFKKDNFKNAGEDNKDKLECRICMTEFEENDELRMLTCMHHFHKVCIDKWFDTSTKCPLCNTQQEIE